MFVIAMGGALYNIHYNINNKVKHIVFVLCNKQHFKDFVSSSQALSMTLSLKAQAQQLKVWALN